MTRRTLHRAAGPALALAMARPPIDEDPGPESPEVTAQPSEPTPVERDDEKVVPTANVGGATPTASGLDSGGDFPTSRDDLANLAEPEPPEAPEVAALHVSEDEDRGGRRSRRGRKPGR